MHALANTGLFVQGLIIYSVCAFILTPTLSNANEMPIVEARNSIKSLVPIDQATRTTDQEQPIASVKSHRRLSSEGSSSGRVENKPRDFDQINVESELAKTHTERREPNGTVYFVERRSSEEFALQILDKAIEPIGEESPNTAATPLSVDDVEPPREVVALVHREDGCTGEQLSADKVTVLPTTMAEDNDSGILVISQVSLNEGKMASETPVHFSAESHPMAINHMEGTKTLPLNRSNKYDRSKSQTLGPSVKPSKSDTDLRSLLFAEIKMLRPKDDEEQEEQFSDPTNDPEGLSAPVETKSPTIPEPPVFDQEQYDKFGTMPKKNFKITTMKRKAPSPPEPTEQELPESTVTLSSPNFASFKSKLEALYSRGPPTTFPKPPAYRRSQTYSPGTDANPNPSPDLEIQLVKVNLRPTDTVNRQKLIFNDVLKSIHADTKPSDSNQRVEPHEEN